MITKVKEKNKRTYRDYRNMKDKKETLFNISHILLNYKHFHICFKDEYIISYKSDQKCNQHKNSFLPWKLDDFHGNCLEKLDFIIH